MSLSLDAEYESSSETYELEPAVTGSAYENNSNVSFTEVFMEQLALTLNVYYTPLLIVLGSIGNLISIVVFFKSKLRLQSTSQYLSALAVSDTLFLWQLLPPWLKAVGASELFSQNGYCQLFVYLSYVSSNLSSWLVVAFTVERFVAVVYPLRRNSMCSVKRARYIIASLTTIALLINLPVLRFAVTSGNDCNIDVLLMAHAARFNLVDTIFSFTLPLAIISVLNAWIMAGVYKVARTRGHLMRQHRQLRPRPPRPPQVMLNHPPRRTHSKQHSQTRITRMLLIVSTVFVILNLPAYTMRIIAYANNMSEHEYSGKYAELQQIGLLFFNTNFGINFLLYCLIGQNFRRALKETFLNCVRGRRILFIFDVADRPARASSVSTSFAQSFSNHTEATGHCAVNNAAGGCGLRRGAACQASGGQCELRRHMCRMNEENEQVVPERRRRRSPQVIQRWRFDNSRQLRNESIELQPLPSANI